jgi:putative Ca2+/H+ antiporter (TMEM165/GDT1 family)
VTAFWGSVVLVAVSEMGDKTQLLALVLAARFRAPWPIIAGIFLATVLNHALAGLVGASVAAWLGPEGLRWVLGLAFLAMAGWVLIPDTLDAEAEEGGRGAFVTTLIAFFLAEMGDKTQIATVGLAAAHPGQTAAVVFGTTVGMLLANVPVVLVGERLAKGVDLSKARFVASALFAALGAWILLAA